VAGETGTTVIGNTQTAVTAIGIVTGTMNVVVIAKTDARTLFPREDDRCRPFSGQHDEGSPSRGGARSPSLVAAWQATRTSGNYHLS
jgi:hypothetical protein